MHSYYKGLPLPLGTAEIPVGVCPECCEIVYIPNSIAQRFEFGGIEMCYDCYVQAKYEADEEREELEDE